MIANSFITADLSRDRQREMLACTERLRAGRQYRAQFKAAKSVGRPRGRLRRALRAVFA